MVLVVSIIVYLVIILYSIVMIAKSIKLKRSEHYIAVITDCYMEGNEFICLGNVTAEREYTNVILYDMEDAYVGMKVPVKGNSDGEWCLHKIPSIIRYVALITIVVYPLVQTIGILMK